MTDEHVPDATDEQPVQNTQRQVVWMLAVFLTVFFVSDCFLLAAQDWAIGGYVHDSILGWAWLQAWVGGLVGFFAPQLMLTVVFAALGDGSSPKRILYTTAVVAVFAMGVVVFGVWWFEAWWSQSVFGFLFPIFLFTVLQLPVWGVRMVLRWTIVSPWSTVQEPAPLRFTVAHLLGWSVFLAIPLTILQATGGLMDAYQAVNALAWCAVLFAMPMFTIHLLLQPGRSRVRIAWGLFAIFALSTLVQLCALSFGFDMNLVRVGMTALGLAVGNTTGIAVFSGCLLVARRLGYRLVTARPVRNAVEDRGTPRTSQL